MDIAKTIKADCGMPTDIAFAVSEKKRQARSSTLKEVVEIIDKLNTTYSDFDVWLYEELKSKILALEKRDNEAR